MSAEPPPERASEPEVRPDSASIVTGALGAAAAAFGAYACSRCLRVSRKTWVAVVKETVHLGPQNARRIRKMLAQPKYSGYQVFNRCAARTNHSRINPIADWVWSREQAHPAIVPLAEWRETQLVTAQIRQRQASGWDRVYAAAAQRGIELRTVRESDTHVLYEAAGRQFVLPRGDLPAAVADEVITILEAGA